MRPCAINVPFFGFLFVLVIAAFFAGCATDGAYQGDVAVYGSYGYYGGGYGAPYPYYGGSVIVAPHPPPPGVRPPVPPPGGRPMPPPPSVQPLPSRPMPAPAPRPMPAARPMPRGGGGGRR